MFLSGDSWIFSDFGFARLKEVEEQRALKEFPFVKIYTTRNMVGVKEFPFAGNKSLLSVTTERGFNLKVKGDCFFCDSDPRGENPQWNKPEIGAPVCLFGGVREPTLPRIKIDKTPYPDREIGGIAGLIWNLSEGKEVNINPKIDKYAKFLKGFFFKDNKLCYLLARKEAFFTFLNYVYMMRNDNETLYSFTGDFYQDFRYILLYHGIDSSFEDPDLIVFDALKFKNIESSDFSLRSVLIEDKIKKIDEVEEPSHLFSSEVDFAVVNGFVLGTSRVVPKKERVLIKEGV